MDQNEILQERIRQLEDENTKLRQANKLALLLNITFKETQKELFHSKLLFKTIFDHIPYGIYWKDLDSKFLGCNEVFKEEFSIHDTQLIIGQTDLSVLQRDSYNSIFELDADVLKSGNERLNHKELHYSKGGSIKWLQTSRVPLMDNDGKIIGLLGIIQDITHQINEQAEKGKMITELKLLEDIVNGGFSIAFIVCNDSRLSIEYVTRNITLLGYNPNDFYSGLLNLKEISNREDFEASVARLKKSTTDTINIEMRLQKSDSTEIWASCNFKRILNIEGEVTHYQIVIIDITELKQRGIKLLLQNEEIQSQNEEIQAQNEEFFAINEELKQNFEELQTLHLDLRESEARFKAFSDQSNFGIVIFKNDKISFCNSAFSRLFGPDGRSMIGLTKSEWVTSFSELEKPNIQNLFSLDDFSRKGNKLNISIIRNQEPYWFEVWVKPLILESSELHLMFTFIDVTSKFLLSEALKEANLNLNATFNCIGDAIITLSGNYRIKNLNIIAERFLNNTLKNCRQKNIFENFEIGNKKEDLLQFFKTVQLHNKEMKYNEILVFKDKPGDKFTISASPVVLDTHERPGLVVLLHKLLEAESTQYTAIVSEKNHSKPSTEEAILKGIIDNSGDGIMLIDNNGMVYEWNHSMESITGYSKSEAQGISIWELRKMMDISSKLDENESDRKNVFLKFLQEALERHIVQSFDIDIKTKTDAIKHVQAAIFPLSYPDKPLVGTIIRDITDKHRIEQNLLKNKALLQSILDCSPVAVYMLNAKGQFEMINRTFEEIFSIKKHAIYGRKAEEILPAFFEAFAFSSDPGDNDFMQQSEEKLNMGSEHKTFLVNKASFFDTTDKSYKYVGLMLDISQRIKTELQLKESEELYRHLVLTSPEAIILSDKSGTILFHSPRSEVLFRESTESLKVKNKIFHYVHSDDLGNAIKNVQEVWQNGLSSCKRYTFLRGDGTSFIGEVNSALVKDHLGNSRGMFSVIRDISDRIRFEEELIQAKDKAEESDRLKSSFLANMSHEIRTPMNAIIGFSSLLLDEALSVDLRRDYVNIITGNSASLMNLIDDIIDFSKIESNQLKISKTAFNLDKLMFELKNLFDETVQLKGQGKLKLLLDDTIIGLDKKIIGDSMRIRQVLVNLISNAIKFTDMGYVRFGYQIIDNSFIRFYVKDTGIGLSADKHELIFERFRQVEEAYTRNYGGTGLGLAICRSLVKLMGGEIWVESNAGSGSVFYFSLPYVLEAFKAPEVEKPQIANSRSLPDWSHCTFLVAEDEYVNYRFIYEGLKRTQAKFIHVENGKLAVETVRTNPEITLVMMDIKMPIMNGFDATKEIKRIRPELPVIAQTAFAMEDDRKKILECGCEEYITKPIDLGQLIVLLSRFVRPKAE